MSHCFPLDAQNPECRGVEGVLGAYRKAFQTWGLYGPTNFAPLIRHAIEYTKGNGCTQFAQKYFVLLIITDGDITDMSETVDAIIDASDLPMSIIIVGT